MTSEIGQWIGIAVVIALLVIPRIGPIFGWLKSKMPKRSGALRGSSSVEEFQAVYYLIKCMQQKGKPEAVQALVEKVLPHTVEELPNEPETN